jgi:hypothetical protein
MNTLFNGNSIGEKGTMAQIRNAFGHRQVTTDVMNSFNYCDDFQRFIAESHVIYLCLNICGMADIDGIPCDSVPRGTPARRQHFLNKVCRKLIDTIWLAPSLADINEVLEADISALRNQWCICNDDSK